MTWPRSRNASIDWTGLASEGPWTGEFLCLIRDNPHVRAQDLADRLGLDKTVFKNDVRKLKGLGLTISHSPGYELSPRGRVFLARSDLDRDRP
ncbi:MAG: HTH domain-containing protein [Acidimicrobiia bacterium]